ncbi:protein rigor mortis [Scaptodrosophila lebanonensis]|uniref:Protein rigor mortis n=1 Tax=Drosophila lebanonensis TaxID=7225 RepID=A0A6J2TWR2_DROLE|nr:protein rigor mortis [Scaptodrosophila lebanonensis]
MSSKVLYNNVPSVPCQSALSVVTPDGGFLYAGLRCINYIAAPPPNGKETPEMKNMSVRVGIIALDVNPLWGKPIANDSKKHGKYFAIVGEDLSVQVWDCTAGEAVSGHKAHQHQQEARELGPRYSSRAVVMSYMSNGNILSMDVNDLVIYCVVSNSYCRRPTFIPSRNHDVTLLRCSPYNDGLFAVGTASGIVMVCDLRQMSIKYKLHSHKDHISGLAWREIGFKDENLSHSNENLKQLATRAEHWRSQILATKNESTVEKVASAVTKPSNVDCLETIKCNDGDMFDIYNFDHLDGEFGAPSRQNICSKSFDNCNDFVGVEKLSTNTAGHSLDYVEACENFKAELQARSDGADVEITGKKLLDTPPIEVTLADCKQVKMLEQLSNSSNNSETPKQDQFDTLGSESTEGSLEVINYIYSSDDAEIVDGDAPKPKREVLHHIYHQAEVHVTQFPPETTQHQTNKPQDFQEISVETNSDGTSTPRPEKDILLVSIDVSDTITIYNTVTGGICGKKFNRTNARGKFSNVQWLHDNAIVSLSKNQLLFWSLEIDGQSKRYKIIKSNLPKCYLSDIISFGVCPITQQIWLCVRECVNLYNVVTSELSLNYNCVSFAVRAIAECPDDVNKIALGCGNRRVSIFDLSKLSPRCIPIKSIHVNQSVYSLSWSPDSTQLAYGTFDGSVGIIDVERMKTVTTFYTTCKKEVYSLVWHDKFIFFVTSRLIGVFDIRAAKSDGPRLIKNIVSPSYVSVRGDFLFVGSDSGQLQLFKLKEDCELIYINLRQLSLMSGYITDIVWNPFISNQFAVVGRDKFVFILNFIEEESKFTILHSFEASDKKASITSARWSSTDSHLLLTCHIEGKICLWNTKEPTQEPLTIIFPCPMWCGIFLPSDENVIMCGGKAIALEFVHIKEALQRKEKTICSKVDALLNVKWATKSLTQPYMLAMTAAEKKRQRKLERRHEKKKNSQLRQDEPIKANEQEEGDKSQDMETQQVTYGNNAGESFATLINPTNCEMPVEKMLQALNLDTSEGKEQSANFLAHSRTSLYLTQKELNRSPLEKLAVVLTENSANIEQSVLVAKLFSTKVVAKELLATELQNLKSSDNKGIAPLWLITANFKLRDELEQHINNKTLTEWHLSLAPSVSYNFWIQCCQAFAEQLLDQGYILHSAMYLMAIHLPTDAIKLLISNEFYKEALLLARVYLPATDPIIRQIINQWLEQLEKIGNLGAAALICVLDNEMMRGYSYLRKFRNCTEEVAKLMEEIKRIGQLDPLLNETDPGPEEQLAKQASETVLAVSEQN